MGGCRGCSPVRSWPWSASFVAVTLGRGSSAGTVADLARTGPSDRVVDVGCGSGTAARLAGRRGSTATGIDPSPWKLRFARAITSVRHMPRVTFLAGSAESMPLPEASATVVWSMSSVHHWGDRVRGLAEARRVLAPGGRLLLAERRVKQGARGLRAHGLTAEQGWCYDICHNRTRGRGLLASRTGWGQGNSCWSLLLREAPLTVTA